MTVSESYCMEEFREGTDEQLQRAAANAGYVGWMVSDASVGSGCAGVPINVAGSGAAAGRFVLTLAQTNTHSEWCNLTGEMTGDTA
jgi:hypothetical protein